MHAKRLFSLAMAVAGLLLMMSARNAEPAAPGPTITVYQSPT